MKKKTLYSIVCAAAMALTISITACGGSDDGAFASTPEAESQAEANAGNGEDAAGAGDEEYFVTLEEAFAEPEVQTEFDTMLASMEKDGMSLSYEVSGNKFIIVYRFTDDPVVLSDDITEVLENGIANQSSAFKDMASVFDEALEQEGVCTVTVRYLDNEGNVLVEGTYAAE